VKLLFILYPKPKMITIKKEGIVLEPTSLKFENQGVFNPACIESNGKIHLFYRASSKNNTSTIGYCELKSPTEVITRNIEPFISPLEPYEVVGIEDPRIVKIDDTYFMTYTAYNGKNALGALMTSKDLKSFQRQGIIVPKFTYNEFNSILKCCNDIKEKYLRFVKFLHKRVGKEVANQLFIWDKNVVFFPKKINGQYAFLHRLYPDIQISYFTEFSELTKSYWENYLQNIRNFTVLESKFPFEASYIGSGCPPIETTEGWLLIYHGVEDTKDGFIYHACAALLDLQNPTIEIGRLKYPLFSPELEWEKIGVVNNVVFPTASILINDQLYIYYGAADTRIGVASVSLTELITEIKNQDYEYPSN
jgi:predicted GH43/DUF377 family glycosyl hydrolase